MPNKSRTPAEDKIRIVLSCLGHKIGVNEASRRAGVAKATIFRWIILYKSGGPSAFEPAVHKKYSAELKANAARDYINGMSSADICIKYRLKSPNQVINWVKEYNNIHESSKTVKDIGDDRIMDKKLKEYKIKDRVKIVMECLRCHNDYARIAEKYGIKYATVRMWVRKYDEMGRAGLEDRRGKRLANQKPRTAEEALRIENARLMKENEEMRMRYDLLKKLDQIERRDASTSTD